MPSVGFILFQAVSCSGNCKRALLARTAELVIRKWMICVRSDNAYLSALVAYHIFVYYLLSIISYWQYLSQMFSHFTSLVHE